VRAAVQVLLAILLCVAHARAETPEQLARAHYLEGKRLYEAGEYRAAVREFEAGYAASPRSEFLLNLGQAYRKLDDLAKAREMYVRFLADAPADDPLRAQVSDLIAEIDRAQPPPAQTPVPPPEQVARAVVERQHPTEPTPPPHRRTWVYASAGAALVAGVVIAIVLLRPSNPVACSAAELGCVDRR